MAAFHVPSGHPETMKRAVGWANRSAAHQVFFEDRRRNYRQKTISRLADNKYICFVHENIVVYKDKLSFPGMS